MSLKDQVETIKEEISLKKGSEWKGLQTTTEKQLESLLWYIEHPKMDERPKLLRQVVDLYFDAKKTNFIKMEGIIRKLDQLSITLGKYDYSKEKETENKPKFTNYVQEIENLRRKAEIIIQTPYGISLPENTKESIIKFINYLNYPNLHLKQKLFDEIHEIYSLTEQQEFIKMQSFNEMLNKIEIKLGKVTEGMKKFKTIKEQKEDLKRERDKLNMEWERFDKKIKAFEQERREILKEKENLEREKSEILKEKEKIERLREDLELDKKKINKQQQELDFKWQKVNEFAQKFNLEG
ncbi:MAG: hypothetical protein P8Y70_16340 [Candidatus Lokiarchaeota archaeon]